MSMFMILHLKAQWSSKGGGGMGAMTKFHLHLKIWMQEGKKIFTVGKIIRGENFLGGKKTGSWGKNSGFEKKEKGRQKFMGLVGKNLEGANKTFIKRPPRAADTLATPL